MSFFTNVSLVYSGCRPSGVNSIESFFEPPLTVSSFALDGFRFFTFGRGAAFLGLFFKILSHRGDFALLRIFRGGLSGEHSFPGLFSDDRFFLGMYL
jgi:hypothetical protein